jgi:holo-[acyl-carrier protein] synthase
MSLGIDVVDISRLRSYMERTPWLERRLFTEAERHYCSTKPDPVMHYAGTLAAKEAVIKALQLGRLVEWAGRIEIHRHASGAPSAIVRSDEQESVIEVSISHEKDTAVAVAWRH